MFFIQNTPRFAASRSLSHACLLLSYHNRTHLSSALALLLQQQHYLTACFVIVAPVLCVVSHHIFFSHNKKYISLISPRTAPKLAIHPKIALFIDEKRGIAMRPRSVLKSHPSHPNIKTKPARCKTISTCSTDAKRGFR